MPRPPTPAPRALCGGVCARTAPYLLVPGPFVSQVPTSVNFPQIIPETHTRYAPAPPAAGTYHIPRSSIDTLVGSQKTHGVSVPGRCWAAAALANDPLVVPELCCVPSTSAVPWVPPDFTKKKVQGRRGPVTCPRSATADRDSCPSYLLGSSCVPGSLQASRHSILMTSDLYCGLGEKEPREAKQLTTPHPVAQQWDATSNTGNASLQGAGTGLWDAPPAHLGVSTAVKVQLQLWFLQAG